MKKMKNYLLFHCSVSQYFWRQTVSAQTKQGHPFTAEELTELQSKATSRKAQRVPSAVMASNKTFNMDSIQYWVGMEVKAQLWEYSGKTLITPMLQ